MTKSFIIAFITLSFFSFGQGNGKVINKVAAQVGDNIILLSDIETAKAQSATSENPAPAGSECMFLEQLMMEQLLVNQAKLDSLPLSDNQVDAEMENRLRIIESKFGSREKLESFYGKTISQLKDEFREQIKEKMLAQEMEQKIVAEVTVTPKEVADFFNKLPKDSIPYINMKLGFQQIVNYPSITKADKKRAYDALSDIRKVIIEE